MIFFHINIKVHLAACLSASWFLTFRTFFVQPSVLLHQASYISAFSPPSFQQECSCQRTSIPRAQSASLQRATFRTTGTAAEQPRDWLKTLEAHRRESCQLTRRGLPFNLKTQDYTFRARIQGSIRPPSPRLDQVCLLWREVPGLHRRASGAQFGHTRRVR